MNRRSRVSALVFVAALTLLTGCASSGGPESGRKAVNATHTAAPVSEASREAAYRTAVKDGLRKYERFYANISRILTTEADADSAKWARDVATQLEKMQGIIRAARALRPAPARFAKSYSLYIAGMENYQYAVDRLSKVIRSGTVGEYKECLKHMGAGDKQITRSAKQFRKELSR